MGFCSESFRFEGGGRNIRIGIGLFLEKMGGLWKGPSIKDMTWFWL